MRLLNRSAGRISRHRRRPLAGLLMLVVGLLMTGGLYTAFSPAQAQSTASDTELVEEGRQLFLVGCAYCHGQNGEGNLTINGKNIGPPLAGVGAASVDFQIETGRMPLVQPGAQAGKKEVVYTDDETAAIAAYVASLAPGPAVPDEADYSLGGLSEEQREEAIQRGGQIFLTNCTACHNFAGQGGAMPRGGKAPNLEGTTPEHIYEALLTGPGNMPSFSNGNLSQEEKRDVIAYLISLREQPSYGGYDLGALGPVTEGLAAWLLGIGGLVVFAIWIAAHTTRTTKQKKGSPA